MKKLWLDDVRPAPNDSWTWVKTVDEAVALLKEGEVAYASLDHDLGADVPKEMIGTDDALYLMGDSFYGSGMDVVLWMVENDVWPTGGITIHSWNPVAARKMCDMIDDYGPYKERCRYVPFVIS